MSWLEWSSSVIGSLAWPVAAFCIALIFRSQIAALLDKIKRLSWGDASVDFSEKLDELESISREVRAESAPAPIPEALPPPPDDRFKQLLDLAPSAAVLDAWRPVESKLRSISADVDPGTRSYAPRQMMLMLLKLGVISPSVHEMLRDLSGLRNAAVHQGDVTVTDALRFKNFSVEVLRELDAASAQYFSSYHSAQPATPPAT